MIRLFKEEIIKEDVEGDEIEEGIEAEEEAMITDEEITMDKEKIIMTLVRDSQSIKHKKTLSFRNMPIRNSIKTIKYSRLSPLIGLK